jgi:hypothetical protein
LNISASVAVKIGDLPSMQPLMRSRDWCGPLAYALLGTREYSDASRFISLSVRGKASTRSLNLELSWSELGSDVALCVNSYQKPELIELASLGFAGIVLQCELNMSMLEVTQRGDRADYWIGPGDESGHRNLMLEVSGMSSDGDVLALARRKATQLLDNPFDAGGYVVAVNFSHGEAILGWAECLVGGQR